MTAPDPATTPQTDAPRLPTGPAAAALEAMAVAQHEQGCSSRSVRVASQALRLPELPLLAWECVVSYLGYRDRAAAALTCRGWAGWAWTPPLPVLKIGPSRDVNFSTPGKLEPWAAKHARHVTDLRTTLLDANEIACLGVLLHAGAALRKITMPSSSSPEEESTVLALVTQSSAHEQLELDLSLSYRQASDWPLEPGPGTSELRYLGLRWTQAGDHALDGDQAVLALDGHVPAAHPRLRLLRLAGCEMQKLQFQPGFRLEALHSLYLDDDHTVLGLRCLTGANLPALRRLAITVHGLAGAEDLLNERALGSLTTLTALYLQYEVCDEPPAGPLLARLVHLKEALLVEDAVALAEFSAPPGELLPPALETLLLATRERLTLQVAHVSAVPRLLVAARRLRLHHADGDQHSVVPLPNMVFMKFGAACEAAMADWNGMLLAAPRESEAELSDCLLGQLARLRYPGAFGLPGRDHDPDRLAFQEAEG